MTCVSQTTFITIFLHFLYLVEILTFQQLEQSILSIYLYIYSLIKQPNIILQCVTFQRICLILHLYFDNEVQHNNIFITSIIILYIHPSEMTSFICTSWNFPQNHTWNYAQNHSSISLLSKMNTFFTNRFVFK